MSKITRMAIDLGHLSRVRDGPCRDVVLAKRFTRRGLEKFLRAHAGDGGVDGRARCAAMSG